MTRSPGGRLAADTLDLARARDLPTYERSASAPWVHLGMGAFARAHLGTYADDLLRAGVPALVRGVSLRNALAEHQLGPQDGLYTVTEREPGVPPAPRVVGAVVSCGTGPEAAVAATAHPDTTFVTLTVTEKGYVRSPDSTTSAPAVVAEALARRHAGGLAPPVVASLDNVVANGSVLRERVLEEADRLDPALARWAAEAVAFPTSVVDRIVPATTVADRDEVESLVGLRDEAAVVAERHRSWVIEAVDGLPPLGLAGVEVVADTGPYLRRKLWLLNGPHSAVAYAGLVAGCATIAEAVVHPQVAPFVARYVADVVEVVGLPASLDGAAFAAEARRRFANAATGHTCAQVGADGSEKLRQRLLPVVAERRRRGLRTHRCALVAAAWLAAVACLPVRGQLVAAVDDPAAEALRTVAPDPRALARLAFAADDAAFADEVAARLGDVLRDGVEALTDRDERSDPS